MRPSEVRLVTQRTGTNCVGLAVQENDGNIQDLTTFDNMPIESGSTLRVCSAGWVAIKALYERIGSVWSVIASNMN